MKLKNVLIVVKDIEKARQFYHDLFGLTMILDNEGNMILTEGLVLQDERPGRSFSDGISSRRTIPVNYILRKAISRHSRRNWKGCIRMFGMSTG